MRAVTAPKLFPCRWCDGKILDDAERLTIGHSAPECPEFQAVMATVTPKTTQFELIDEKGNLLASSLNKKGGDA